MMSSVADFLRHERSWVKLLRKINRYRMKINYYFMRKVEITKEKVTYFSAICILLLLISLNTKVEGQNKSLSHCAISIKEILLKL